MQLLLHPCTAAAIAAPAIRAVAGAHASCCCNMAAGFYIAIERNVDVKKLVGIEGNATRRELQSAMIHAFLQTVA